MPEASVRFGLMLEAYCRGAVAHIKSLLRQVSVHHFNVERSDLLLPTSQPSKDAKLARR